MMCTLSSAPRLLHKARAFKATLKEASFSACISSQEAKAEQHEVTEVAVRHTSAFARHRLQDEPPLARLQKGLCL